MLIIPACGEVEDFLVQLMQHQQHTKVLVVMVVNRPKGHTNSVQWRTENDVLLLHLSMQYTEIIDLPTGHRLLTVSKTDNCQYDVLLLDFNTQAFDPNKGVGLARRIAADTALFLIEQKTIKTAWIFSTDADVVLPTGYFEVVEAVPAKSSALSLCFVHITGYSNQENLQYQYDFKLKYYQMAVRFIGAAYDYIPLGSTLIVAANCYAQVRGFPCRSGGEDFYILNKLAKLGSIYQPQQPVIEIQSRFSDRVPFGTGPAISKIQQQQNEGEVITYYHPQIFHVLKSWRLTIEAYYDTQQLPKDDRGLNKHWELDAVLQQAMSQIKSTDRWQQFVHEWFDAFKILKSVHFLRKEYESISMNNLLESHAYKEILDVNDF
ncbi:hypothetical protein MNBD_GAMMA02-1229 [hydrothermal vent metagenome]|uniref:Glycosyltransferase 2-like domain-containing protein n=1 Tax=hydrothermal vent metagenome TaxID=652676 RepID=A0A3B0VWR3_9ZZZZ